MLSLSVLSRMRSRLPVGQFGMTTKEQTPIGIQRSIESKLRPELGRKLQIPRIGIMGHYDASVTDKGALAWLLDPRCKLGYNFLIWDNARIFEIIPRHLRAPHAGATRSSRSNLKYGNDLANSAFYGVAIAAGGRAKDRATREQIESFAWLAHVLFEEEGWDKSETWRFTDHESEAWPRGRKKDVRGPVKTSPVMLMDEVIDAFKEMS